MTELSPKVREEIGKLYASFERELREIAHEHRVSVSDLLHQADEAFVAQIKTRLEGANS